MGDGFNRRGGVENNSQSADTKASDIHFKTTSVPMGDTNTIK